VKIPIDIKTGAVKKEPEMTDVIVGIDLGTTHSLVAYMDNGTPKIILDESGKNALVPSVIHFNQQGQVIVGDQAKSMLNVSPERTIKSIKRLMGKSYADIREYVKYAGYEIIDDGVQELVKIKVDETFHSPVGLSAEILKTLKKRAEHFLQRPVKRAVITVPAYFNDSQRQATRDAGKLAGLDVLRIINEPTAASLAYGLGLQSEEHELVAVYDLGGGTFDISILQIENGIFEVLSTHGDTDLGGDDLDDAIANYWLENVSGLAEQIQNPKEKGLLLSLAEKAKICLSGEETFSAEFRESIQLYIDKMTFHQLIQPFIDRTLMACSFALRDAGIQKNDVHKLILVGGSTRIPYIKQRLYDFFGKKPFDSLDPDETVALGASIQADILAGNRKDVVLLDVTPLSLGIETVGGLMDVIIPRNSKIPQRAGRQYTTSVDGQKNLKISVYQGERDLVENNRKLGEFILRNIPAMPAGLPKIEIQFLLDADGILVVKAIELRSQTEAQVEINASYGISEEKMAEMLLDSIENAAKDAKIKSLIEARVEANNVLLSSEKFINQNKDIMSDTEVSEMNTLIEIVKASLVTEDKNQIDLAVKNLNDFAAPIAQKSLDKVISHALKGKTI
jgi:Fe-S protein assembly chaperone HscA